jgi:restriction endonuclease S subunit
VKLNDIATIRTGLVLSRKKAALDDPEQYSYKQITLKSFSNSVTLQSDYFDDFVSIEKIDNKYLSQAGDIIVRLREPNTAVYIDAESVGLVVPSLFAIVSVDEPNINNTFLAYYLNSMGVKKVLERELKGTTIPMIKIKDLAELTLHLPSLNVQQNIVDLMLLSEKEITLLERLKEEKQRYSQAILETIIQQNKEEK